MKLYTAAYCTAAAAAVHVDNRVAVAGLRRDRLLGASSRSAAVARLALPLAAAPASRPHRSPKPPLHPLPVPPTHPAAAPMLYTLPRSTIHGSGRALCCRTSSSVTPLRAPVPPRPVRSAPEVLSRIQSTWLYPFSSATFDLGAFSDRATCGGRAAGPRSGYGKEEEEEEGASARGALCVRVWRPWCSGVSCMIGRLSAECRGQISHPCGPHAGGSIAWLFTGDDALAGVHDAHGFGIFRPGRLVSYSGEGCQGQQLQAGRMG